MRETSPAPGACAAADGTAAPAQGADPTAPGATPAGAVAARAASSRTPCAAPAEPKSDLGAFAAVARGRRGDGGGDKCGRVEEGPASPSGTGVGAPAAGGALARSRFTSRAPPRKCWSETARITNTKAAA